jgi:hypothetical protein
VNDVRNRALLLLLLPSPPPPRSLCTTASRCALTINASQTDDYCDIVCQTDNKFVIQHSLSI